jgi:hypothetical protein
MHTLILRNIYCFATAKTIRERASVLRFKHIACLIMVNVVLRYDIADCDGGDDDVGY